jgi:hypothetical protein
MVMIVALPPWVAAVIDVAVLRLATIGVFGAFRPALGAVDVKVADAPPVSADKTLGAGPVSAVGLIEYAHGQPLDDPNFLPLNPLAGRPFDGTGAVERSDVRGDAGVGRVLHVS